MGNKASKQTGNRKSIHKKSKHRNLSPKLIAFLLYGYIHIELKDTVIPKEIIHLCCKYHGYFVTTLTLPTLSNTQYAVCQGHLQNISCLSLNKNARYCHSNTFATIILSLLSSYQYLA